jgi:hypothetical protein
MLGLRQQFGNTTTQYSYFICNGLDHKIFDYLHQQVALEMFKNKKANFEVKKKNVAVNMVLAIMTKSQAFKVDAFKEKEMK